MNTPGTHRAGCKGCYPHTRRVKGSRAAVWTTGDVHNFAPAPTERVNVVKPHGWTGVTYDARRQPGRRFGPAPKPKTDGLRAQDRRRGHRKVSA